jgi:hypothetical protein
VTASKAGARRRFAGAKTHPEFPPWAPQSHPDVPREASDLAGARLTFAEAMEEAPA